MPLLHGAGRPPLDLVAELTEALARGRDLDATLRLGLHRAVTRLGAEAGSLFLREADGSLLCRAAVGPVDLTGLRLAGGTGIVGQVIATNQPCRIAEAGIAPAFAPEIDHATGFITRSVLCTPIAGATGAFGAIELFNKHDGGTFSPADLTALQTLAAAAALALDNARLVADLATERSLRAELDLAAEIQRAMLPPPRPEGFPVHGATRPARGVSGDFYEIVPLADGTIAFAVGDVAGKGMNAALLMARVASLFRCLVKREPGPGRVLAAIDAELAETSCIGRFVTLAAGRFDPRDGTVTLANAGHEPARLVGRDGTIRALPAGMPPLGIDPALFAAGCPETRLALEGGTLYLLTDGLTEARGRDGTPLGAEAVCGLLAAFAAMPAAERLETTLRALEAGAERRDDATLLVVEDLRAPPRPGLQRRFPARPGALAAIRATVRAATGRLGAEPTTVEDCVLAVDEACQNIIRHAYRGGEGDLILHVDREGGRLVFRLMDFAAATDPVKIKARARGGVRPGGLGIHLIQAVMDRVGLHPPPLGVGNLLVMERRIGGS